MLLLRILMLMRCGQTRIDGIGTNRQSRTQLRPSTSGGHDFRLDSPCLSSFASFHGCGRRDSEPASRRFCICCHDSDDTI